MRTSKINERGPARKSPGMLFRSRGPENRGPGDEETRFDDPLSFRKAEGREGSGDGSGLPCCEIGQSEAEQSPWLSKLQVMLFLTPLESTACRSCSFGICASSHAQGDDSCPCQHSSKMRCFYDESCPGLGCGAEGLENCAGPRDGYSPRFAWGGRPHRRLFSPTQTYIPNIILQTHCLFFTVFLPCFPSRTP